MAKNKKIRVLDTDVVFFKIDKDEFLSLTDIARHRDAERTDYILQNWLRNRSTIEFIGLWEMFNNPDFNPIEFDGIKNMSGSNSFTLTAKRWIDATNAIGIVSRPGRYGGTFAHRDIAFEFATWLSAEFKFYLIKEFQRLKKEEHKKDKLEWNLQRTIAKINYRIHTDAIRDNLIIPKKITRKQAGMIYSDEAELLNVALFGLTSKEWHRAHPEKTGNIRDHATLQQLVVLSNIESINALLIGQKIPQAERLIQLNRVAITQMTSLADNELIRQLNENPANNQATCIKNAPPVRDFIRK